LHILHKTFTLLSPQQSPGASILGSPFYSAALRKNTIAKFSNEIVVLKDIEFYTILRWLSTFTMINFLLQSL